MRVILADDAVMVRQGVARLLAERGIEVVGQAGQTVELLRLVAAAQPDVAIIDIRMPPTQTDEGLVAAREIRRRFPAVGTLVLSQHADSGYAFELIAGAMDQWAICSRIGSSRWTSSWTPSNASGPAGRRGADPRRRPARPLGTPGRADAAREGGSGARRPGQDRSRHRLELTVTRKTVEAHVRNILAKLDCRRTRPRTAASMPCWRSCRRGADSSRLADGRSPGDERVRSDRAV